MQQLELWPIKFAPPGTDIPKGARLISTVCLIDIEATFSKGLKITQEGFGTYYVEE